MSTTTTRTDRAAALAHLTAMFGEVQPDYVFAVWTAPDKRTFWFPTGSTSALNAAADRAVAEASRGQNVYVSAGLFEKALGSNRRGSEAEVVGLVGFPADVDVASPAHKKGNLPPDEATALQIIGKTGVRPTVGVWSGHGAQGWVLFHEPWFFSDADERAKAKGLSIRWQRALKTAAAPFDVDSVPDLSRVLRVCGTINSKVDTDGNPLPVVSVELRHADGPRYDPGELAAMLPPLEEPKREAPPRDGSHGNHAGSLSDAQLLAKAMTAKNGGRFARLWSGDLSMHDGNDSAADLGLCDLIAFWTGDDPQRIDRLFRQSGLMRPKWDEVHYADGRTYGQATMQKALEGRTEFYTPGGPNPDGAYSRDSSQATGGDDDAPPGDATPWPERKPLPGAVAVPTLPPALVPAPFREWLVDVAERACLPLEYLACPAIVAASAVIGRACGVRPWRFDDFTVIPNLWGGIIGRPSTMKSYALAEGTSPLERLAATASQSHKEAKAAAASRLERLEAEVAAIQEAMRQRARGERSGKATKDGATPAHAPNFDDLEAALTAKRAELATAQEGVKARRFMTSDATVEKLGELLAENPRGLLVKRDELAGWLRTIDRAGREGEREFYLEAWNGDGHFDFDRIGRGHIEIEATTVSVVGGVQPGKLRAYIDEAAEGKDGADGMVQRLQLTVWPDDPGPWELPSRWPNRDARNRAFAVFEKLDKLAALLGGVVQVDEHDNRAIPHLRFAADAQPLADAWRNALEQRLRSSEFAAAPAFESHLGKFRSLMPSLALIFHLLDVAAGDAQPGPVSLKAAQLAAGWCDFLEAHARKVYASEVYPGVEAARALADKVTDGTVKDGDTVRSIYYARHWQGLADAEAVYAALDVLAAVNWVRLEEVRADGRPSQVVRLHPDLREASGG